jgi:hypothetical protein
MDDPNSNLERKPAGACEKYFISGKTRLWPSERTKGGKKLTYSPKMQAPVSIILCTPDEIPFGPCNS